MNRNCCLVVIAFVLACGISASAQTHLSVDVEDPVYRLIELGELKGALSRLSAVRPYSHSQVVRLLNAMWDRRSVFSAVEQQILQETMERFHVSRTGVKHGNISHSAGVRTFQAGSDFKSNLRLNVHEAGQWYLDSATRAYLRGDLASWLSYQGSVGFTLDRVGYESSPDRYGAFSYPAFVPYGFSKQWDAFHLSFGSPRYSRGNLDYPTISYDLATDITLQFYEDELTLRTARLRREWGMADGSLTLSGTARPFLGVEAQARFAPWIALSHITGSLADWSREAGGASFSKGTLPDDSTGTFQKLFTLQRLELFPFPWLYLAASSSVIGAKRLELGYMSPLLFSLIYQNLIGDIDNVGVGIDVAFTVAPYGKAYFSFYTDEMEITNLSELFTRPRNMFAIQTGIKVPVPRLPFTELIFQYTKIEPFTYAHYPTIYPETYSETDPLYVETSYTHDGENLAYYLYPNSDEFLVKIACMPIARLTTGLEYRLVRHGDNPSKDLNTVRVIFGAPEYYLNYSLGIDNFPDKDFLHDGLYDFNHILTLSGEYTLPNTQVTLGLSYSFSYTYWEPNASGEADRAHEMRNIFGASVRVFR